MQPNRMTDCRRVGEMRCVGNANDVSGGAFWRLRAPGQAASRSGWWACDTTGVEAASAAGWGRGLGEACLLRCRRR